MSQFFWFSYNAVTVIVDSTFIDLKIDGTSRKYKVQDYAGRSGGDLRGFGQFNSKMISVGKKWVKEATGGTAWNNTRRDLLKMFTLPKDTDIYFNIKNSTDNRTIRTQVFPMKTSGDKYKNIAITDVDTIQFISPSGVFVRNDSTNSDSYAYTGPDTEESFTTDNDGIVETYPIIKFTPSSNATYFDIKIANDYGIRLGGTFLASNQIIFDMSDLSLTIAGQSQQTRQFLTDGSPFFLENGTNTIYVSSDSAGTFIVEYNERYI